MSSLWDLKKSADKAKSMVWTDEQQAIFDAVKNLPRGGALGVCARAGTGKTTTAEHSFPFTRRPDERGKAAFLAFNKKNGDELDRRTPPNVLGCTFHALAMRIIKPDEGVNLGKKWAIAKERIDQYKLRAPAVQLAGLAQNLAFGLEGHEASVAEFERLISEYGIRHQKRYRPVDVARAGKLLFDECVRQIGKTYDFDDMLYKIARDGGGRGFEPLDWLYVDEAQDTNPVQLLMIDRIRSAGDGGCRLVFLGDPRQAIYGWRGAGTHGFDDMVDRYGATVLPLTITQRCPRRVVQSAQELVPDIRPRESADDGEVTSVWAGGFSVLDVPNGSSILCRNNAPLLTLALDAILNDRPIHMAGKDLEKKIVKVLDDHVRDDYGRRPPHILLRDALDKLREELKDRPMTYDIVKDDVTAASAMLSIVFRGNPDGADAYRDYEDLLRAIEKVCQKLLFDPEKGQPDGIILSTIHRAKGLEWDNVYFYSPELIPSKTARLLGGWHLEQEVNLDYVARTRAKRSLTFVRSREKTDPWGDPLDTPGLLDGYVPETDGKGTGRSDDYEYGGMEP